MAKRRSILIGTALVAGAALWYLFRPDALVVSKTVNESFPVAEASAPAMAESPGMAHSSMSQESGMSHESAMSEGSAMTANGSADPVKLASGQFHTNAHETKGIATIYRLEDGRLVLRLTEFVTSNGPDVRVYLVAAVDVQKEGAAKRAGIVDLGPLKGNVGDQNYDVPVGVDLAKYRAVSIWCRRFSVNFGAAPLTAAM